LIIPLYVIGNRRNRINGWPSETSIASEECEQASRARNGGLICLMQDFGAVMEQGIISAHGSRAGRAGMQVMPLVAGADEGKDGRASGRIRICHIGFIAVELGNIGFHSSRRRPQPSRVDHCEKALVFSYQLLPILEK
jgi:hypothetical protein